MSWMQFLFTRTKKKPKRPTGLQALELDVDGQLVMLHFKHHPRARRMTLKFNPGTTSFSLTLPPHVKQAEAQKFAQSQMPWMTKQLARAHEPIAFMPGATIPVRGIDHVIHHAQDKRGTVWIDPLEDATPVVWVAGKEPHISRRITDWLKQEARNDLSLSVKIHAQNMALAYDRVSVRDQKSRWGSCSSNGTLSFSWRLILAPDFVLDYVAAHEVAHIAHMNHGPDFWALVAQAIPEMEHAKNWLKKHGSALHRYGA